PVPELTPSLGIEPFVYLRPTAPEQEANVPPKVRSVHPENPAPGSIVTLSGAGFLETSSVVVITDHGVSRNPEADFRIVSDSRLDVEVPAGAAGNLILIVSNPLGTTAVVSPRHLEAPRPHAPPGIRHLQVVKPNALLKEMEAKSTMYFVEKG